MIVVFYQKIVDSLKMIVVDKVWLPGSYLPNLNRLRSVRRFPKMYGYNK
jgi:hypothetical protein